MTSLTCFKAYDIRGQLGSELNDEIAYRIGRAFGQFLKVDAAPKMVVIGGDARLTSKDLKAAIAKGLIDAGVDVIDLGMTGTEEIYFATQYLGVNGGLEVTASHNPMNYNGMKMVREGSRPISGDTGLLDIKRLAEEGHFKEPKTRGTITSGSILQAYIDHLMSYVDTRRFKPLKLVVNAGNGAAGPVIDALEARFKTMRMPVELVKVHHEPDGSFPHGIPNPMLIENRAVTRDAVIAHGADMGIAWDGDFDRCFLFDEKGRFIEGYYIVGLLADAFLQKNPHAKVIYDPRLIWNTIDQVNAAGGVAIQSKSGHTFLKERMRAEDAIYGGEMSAHHYFRDFAYCDSGMIPWLLVAELLSQKQVPLSEMVEERILAYPISGEINRELPDPETAIRRVLDHYKETALKIDYTDGVSLEFDQWRFNLRSSNTEPVVRLNVESRRDIQLMALKTKEVLSILTI
ncbi:phosphomannomutase CpsG [Paremcibacter congregatus]|uniref:Phosphomannomutase CpsG n=1 Tax=Paremcibacter congregatus TaxID=2043170 RepID=A0A2G4YRY1_9PROT|nr:phosphomannomutase CpsG [Paremcibacter congregatus]PHZ85099.1 phosphomannomutase CpsG [Paremcibacter congregatus]QDE27951.1 phosphomannomutase CpsG [Paremcibacter congregatus]